MVWLVGAGFTVRMFEGGVFPRVPAGGAVGALVLTAMRRRLSSPTGRGLTRHWWPLPRGFGSWVWRRLVALGCLVWGLAGWGSWPRPA